MNDKPLDLFWFLPVSGDGTYLGTDKGNRPADFGYLQEIAQAADRLGIRQARSSPSARIARTRGSSPPRSRL